MNSSDFSPAEFNANVRSSFNAILFALLFCPVFLISLNYYSASAIACAIAYLAQYFTGLARFNLAHVPRMRLALYIDWPLSYLAMLVASFQSESWGDRVFFLILLYQLPMTVYLVRKITKSYYPTKD